MVTDGNDRRDDNSADSEKKQDSPADNKVVPFPSHKVRRPKSQGGSNPQEGRDNFGINRKNTLVVSLLSLMLFATFLSSRVNQSHDVVRMGEDQSRGLASVTQSQRRDLDEDLVLAKKIARQSLREPASRGHEPTAQDLLSHGELASAYAIQYNKDGALRQIEFALQSGNTPRRLEDPSQFLLNHKDLMQIGFDSVKKSESIRDNESLIEDYELTVNGQSVAKVYFKFLKDRELHSMKVEVLDDSQRNPANSK